METGICTQPRGKVVHADENCPNSVDHDCRICDQHTCTTYTISRAGHLSIHHLKIIYYTQATPFLKASSITEERTGSTKLSCIQRTMYLSAGALKRTPPGTITSGAFTFLAAAEIGWV